MKLEGVIHEVADLPATVHVTARVPIGLAREFERVAVAADRSVSAELRRVMRAHVQCHMDEKGEERA